MAPIADGVEPGCRNGVQLSSLLPFFRALGHHVEGLPDGLDDLITFVVSVKVDVLRKERKAAAATV